jgi:nucleotide-binding universal stress UspA family protein
LIVREPRSIAAWVDGKQSLNILAGFDFSASSKAAIRWIASQEAIARSNITVAHAPEPVNERTWLGIAAPRSTLSCPPSIKQSLEEEIQKYVGGELITAPRIVVNTDRGRPGPHVIGMGHELRADLLVVGTSERRGLARLGSVSRAVTHYSEKNVAVIPSGWKAAVGEAADNVAAINRPNEYAVAA